MDGKENVGKYVAKITQLEGRENEALPREVFLTGSQWCLVPISHLPTCRKQLGHVHSPSAVPQAAVPYAAKRGKAACRAVMKCTAGVNNQ